MGESTVEFFEGLALRPPNPGLLKAEGAVRFDLEDDGRLEHWVVTIAGGKARATRAGPTDKADAVVRSPADQFDRVVRGELNPKSASMRMLFTVEGDLKLFTFFHRLFPGPPGARDPRVIVRERAR